MILIDSFIIKSIESLKSIVVAKLTYAINFFFLRDFIFKKTLFEKLQYLKQS